MNPRKENTRRIADTARYIDSNLSSIKGFNSQIDFFEKSISRAKELIPQLKKQMENLENKLPSWREGLRVNRLSLKAHRKDLIEQEHLFRLLKEKDKILTKIKKLEKRK